MPDVSEEMKHVRPMTMMGPIARRARVRVQPVENPRTKEVMHIPNANMVMANFSPVAF
jgi:hypothetical protein